MNIIDEFYNEGLVYNRFIGEDIELPYNFENIKVQPNDTVSSDLLNIKFDHLFDNFMSLYRNSKIASNVIPISSTAIAGVTGNGVSTQFAWYFNLSARQFGRLSQNASMVGADNTKSSLLIKNVDLDRYSLFISNGTELKVLNFNSQASSIGVVFSQTEVDAGYGVRYKDLCDLEYYDQYLYALDCELNQLIKYDASGFIGDNNVTNNRLYYVDSIGNKGNFLAKTAFNDPKGITIVNDILYVLDSGNSSVKTYDINLNWKQTYRLYQDFLSAFPIDIASDKYQNIYILTQSKKILKYNNDFTKKEIFDFNNILLKDENVLKIVFSKTNDNIFYLVTDKNVFKKFISYPNNTIGKYLLYLFKYDDPAERIKSFTTAPTTDNSSDRNILFSVSGNAGKLGNFYDNLNLFDVLAVRDFDIYSSNEIAFDKNEYVQSWVFNKNLSKLILNHMRLRDQIIGKFIASVDYKGNIAFKGTRYLLPEEINSIYFEQDVTFFVGANETFTSSVVNRALKKIYDIQLSLIKILREEVVRVPVSTAPIILN